MVATKVITAKELMRRKLITLHPKDKMHRVQEIFETYSIRHIPILTGDRVVGIISLSDYHKLEGIARNSFDAFLKDQMLKLHTVDQYMTRDVICCKLNTPLLNILDLFLENEIHSLLVVEGTELKGIITPQDILLMIKDDFENE